MNDSQTKPTRVALTLGDVAGIGPEVVARSLVCEETRARCAPLVVGDPDVLKRALDQLNISIQIDEVDSPANHHFHNEADKVFCWNPGQIDVSDVPPGRIDARAGNAAYQWLAAATDAALNNEIDAIVTAPLHKAALHAGGHHYPGHTEILAERCGVSDFAMMLYLPHCSVIRSPYGMGVAHVTLHTSIASVPSLLTAEGIHEKIHLVHNFLQRLGCTSPRVGICALNPHAGEEGLFGDEEIRLITPAVERARMQGVDAIGPDPADTLLQRAVHGAFDGIVAMYHDQGHIALKLIAFQKAVNVTLGLPIVRTSPSHGTGFDISWRSMADSSGMKEAIRVAVELANRREQI